MKGCAIWTASGKEFVAGDSDLVLGFAGTYTAHRHDRIMVDLLERLVDEGWSMTPTSQDLLNACILTLATPPRPEDAGVFAAARIRPVALTNKLVALEATDAAAVRVRENAAIRSLLAKTGPSYRLCDDVIETTDGDYSIAALDKANAKLRRLLIRLHEAAELAGNTELDRNILKFYREMAQRRELHLPPVKPLS